ncbi:MAG: hypothetical protein FJY99_10700 [Candidatus Sericytochromatia bacterium]|nr:hypothetical protein [Candidatus Tanganyikabacteria bacterium]
MRRPLAVVVASLAVVMLAGCPGSRTRDPARDDAPVPGRPDLARLGWKRLAVVAPLNRSGVALAGSFLETVARQVGQRGWPLRPGVIDRPGESHPPASWWERQARELGVQGFVTATVTALRYDERLDRAYAAATCGLLDQRGHWVWSRRVTGVVVGDALPSGSNIGQNGKQSTQAHVARGRLMAAVLEAAKEFAVDFRIP